jgi:hypothetical protein
MRTRWLCLVLTLAALRLGATPAFANPPVASYVFPAGGQRGTTVPIRVGGLFLHEKCGFDLTGRGLTASPQLARTERIWFEGPLLPLPESQQQEDYPADMLGSVAIAPDAPVGACRGRLFTSQGAAGGLVFVVGELPEVVERETDGDPIPEPVKLPVTVNGRIFPRDDVDLWEFDATAGETITAFVHAKSINSPLEPRVEILDAAGRVLAETMMDPVAGADASVRLAAPAAGKYRVRITDVRSFGGPQYVYRLTLTADPVPVAPLPLKVEPDDLPDVIAPHEATVKPPVALNGRVAKPGASDEWKVVLKKESRYVLELQARRAGSPLCGVVTILDADGKELARAASDGSTDPFATFQPPADGAYVVRVSERFRDRGGESFVYRLRVTHPNVGPPGFRLTVPVDALTVLRGGSVKVRVNAVRTGGFSAPIELTVSGLPRGAAEKPGLIPSGQSTAELTIQADPNAHVAARRVTIVGTATIDGNPVRQTAVVQGTRFLAGEPTVLVGVGMPAPFKIVDQYVMTSAPRGEVYRRRYRLDRGGFDGPIRVMLADRQARHLQGVTGPVVVVPPGETEFEYPALLPPWMEMGRTCRVCVMAVGTVKDADGSEHTVSFSSVEQNQQMIVVVGPGRLDLTLGKGSVLAAGEVRVPVTVSRGEGVSGPVTVEAVIPAHWKGVTAAALTIPVGATTGELALKFGPDAGPFNVPLTIRATASGGNTPVTAEAKLDVVR